MNARHILSVSQSVCRRSCLVACYRCVDWRGDGVSEKGVGRIGIGEEREDVWSSCDINPQWVQESDMSRNIF